MHSNISSNNDIQTMDWTKSIISKFPNSHAQQISLALITVASYRLISIVINRKFQFSRCTILLLSLPWWNAAYPAAINDGIIHKDDFDDSPKERKKERKRGNKILFDPHRRKHNGWNGTSRLQPAKYLWYRLYPLQGSKLALPRYLYRDSVIHDVNFSFFFFFFCSNALYFP